MKDEVRMKKYEPEGSYFFILTLDAFLLFKPHGLQMA